MDIDYLPIISQNTQKSNLSHNKLNSSAFTLVEMLIVIVIIGIIAAISVMSYSGIMSRVHDSAVQSDLSSLNKKLQTAYVSNDDYRWNVSPTIAMKVSKGSYAISPKTNLNLVYCYSMDDSSIYSIIAMSKSGNAFYASSESGGVVAFTGTWSATSSYNTCASLGSSIGLTFSNTYTGYSSQDTTSGPWRSWTN